MAQFDVHRYSKRGGAVRFVIDLQSDLLERLETRVVAPLYEKKSGERRIAGLNPEIDLGSKVYYVSMAELAAIDRKELGERVGSILNRRTEMIAGIDLLFTGI